MKNKTENRIKDLEAFIKKMWSCSCVRKGYKSAANKTMFVDADAAKYGEVLIELKELVASKTPAQ